MSRTAKLPAFPGSEKSGAVHTTGNSKLKLAVPAVLGGLLVVGAVIFYVVQWPEEPAAGTTSDNTDEFEGFEPSLIFHMETE